jgi:hypothetical protein
MDMGILIRVIKRLVQTIRLFFEIAGIIQIILWFVGGGAVTGGGIIASLKGVPVIIPIAVLLIGVGILAYATIRTVHRYRQWNNLRSIPELDDVMNKALDIHIHMGKLHDAVIEQNKRKNIKSKLRQTLAKKYLEAVGITVSDLASGINPDGTFTKGLYRRIRRFYDLKEGDYSTALPHLKGYGRLLDKAKLGLRDAIRADSEYDQLIGDFMRLQLRLTIPSKTVDEVNALPELSYGLYSASIGVNLAHEGREWYEHVPDSWLRRKDEANNVVGAAYLKAAMWAKGRVRRAMFKEAVSD